MCTHFSRTVILFLTCTGILQASPLSSAPLSSPGTCLGLCRKSHQALRSAHAWGKEQRKMRNFWTEYCYVAHLLHCTWKPGDHCLQFLGFVNSALFLVLNGLEKWSDWLSELQSLSRKKETQCIKIGLCSGGRPFHSQTLSPERQKTHCGVLWGCWLSCLSVHSVFKMCVLAHITLSTVVFGWVVLKCVVPRLPYDIPSLSSSQTCNHPQCEVSWSRRCIQGLWNGPVSLV